MLRTPAPLNGAIDIITGQTSARRTDCRLGGQSKVEISLGERGEHAGRAGGDGDVGGNLLGVGLKLITQQLLRPMLRYSRDLLVRGALCVGTARSKGTLTR